jgi:DNA-binding response OmpR family regulator
LTKVLLVEDDPALAAMVSEILNRDGLLVECTADGASAALKLKNEKYDLAILDWELPGMTGVEICSAVRKQGLTLPILMLTSRVKPSDKELGLDTGADDYLTKPFDLRELSARVKALMRRPVSLHSNELCAGDISVSLQSATVYKNGEVIELMPAEYALLEFLLRNKGKAFSVEELLLHVWKADAEVTFSAVTTCIKRLRDKIDSEGRNSILKNVHGMGYLIEA